MNDNQTPSLPQAVLTDDEVRQLRKQIDGRHPVDFAAIRAIESAILSRMGGEAVPAGWKLVPVEPDSAMRKQGTIAVYEASQREYDLSDDEMRAGYRAMLAASPTSPAQQAADVQGERRPVTAFEDATLRKAAMRSATVVSAGAAAQSVPKGGAVCARCNGTGVVDDGEIDCYSNGEPFAHGPIKCVKDCPACGNPQLHNRAALAASAPTVGGALKAAVIEAFVSTNQCTREFAECMYGDQRPAFEALARALATQEPSAAAEPVADGWRQRAAGIVRAWAAQVRDGTLHTIPYFSNGVFESDLRDLADCLATPPTPPSAPAGAEWEKLRDPQLLHAALLRGLPAKLTREQFLHLAGAAPAGAGEGENARRFERMFLAACESLGEISEALGIPEDEAEAANGNELILEAIRDLRADPMPVVTAAKRLLALYEDMRGEREEDEVFINLRAAVEAAEAAPPSHEGPDARDALLLLLLAARPFVEGAATRTYDGTNGDYIRRTARDLLDRIDAARAGGEQ